MERVSAEEVAELILELITHSLQHEGKQDNHPQPVGSTERGRVEQRIGSEERSSEGNQCGEGELPLASCGIDDEAFSLVGLAYGAHHRVSTLYE